MAVPKSKRKPPRLQDFDEMSIKVNRLIVQTARWSVRPLTDEDRDEYRNKYFDDYTENLQGLGNAGGDGYSWNIVKNTGQ